MFGQELLHVFAWCQGGTVFQTWKIQARYGRMLRFQNHTGMACTIWYVRMSASVTKFFFTGETLKQTSFKRQIRSYFNTIQQDTRSFTTYRHNTQSGRSTRPIDVKCQGATISTLMILGPRHHNLQTLHLLGIELVLIIQSHQTQLSLELQAGVAERFQLTNLA